MVEQADGSVWLWLEEVHDADDVSWDLERHILSHLNTQRSNLFARWGANGQDQTVVNDWSFLGTAAAGEDLGMQVSGNLFNLEVESSAARRYQETAFEAYVDGLRLAGWQGNREAVRFAYATAASLRYVPFGAGMMANLVDETKGASWADNLAKKRGCAVEDVLQGWGEVLHFLLNVADEARQLADRV